MLDEYNQIQKQMQQAARDVSGTQPAVSKDLRDAMGEASRKTSARACRPRWMPCVRASGSTL